VEVVGVRVGQAQPVRERGADGDVAEAVSAGDATRAEAAMRAILAEAQEAMEQAYTPETDAAPRLEGAAGG
jgi:DNA-binding GntR family transcriptional regulator